MQEGDDFCICVPVMVEVLFGIGIAPRAAENRVEWQRLCVLLTNYDAREQDAVFAAELQITLRRRGRQLETIDALIAALALRYDLILLTTDRDFQAVPNLAQENWIQR